MTPAVVKDAAALLQERRALALSRSPVDSRDFDLMPVSATSSAESLLLVAKPILFDVDRRMHGGPPTGWFESIGRGAFSKTLSERPGFGAVSVFAGDEILSATQSATITFEEDRLGLRVEAKISPSPQLLDGLRLRLTLFFTVRREQWNGDYTFRRISELSLTPPWKHSGLEMV